ncbi:RdgB/HAM1 family non-canonical purine NTP pyrophosphatase [candidate division KSB1 bacterium]|nr:RdgB/HAM1 family non-canonical purine NTP pyrophosphatase [candidate division KSB1 bacterium]
MLLLATRNRDKISEIQEALRGLSVRLIPAAEWGELPEVEEDQDTLQGNAIKKARMLADITGIPTLADDTGLEVAALNGAPGVHSSRYSGENATYEENVRKLLREMQTIPDGRRQARFRCVMAVAMGEQLRTVEGECRGMIIRERRGQGGFGYDPVFLLPELDKTFAELTLNEKNRISHRGIALRKAREVLRELFGIGE